MIGIKWPEVAFTEEERAKEYVERYNSKLSKLKERVNQIFPNQFDYFDDNQRFNRWYNILERNKSSIQEIQLKHG